MTRLFTLAITLLAVACSGTREPLEVKHFILRDQERDGGSDPMARMEKESRLRGAISMEERRQRLGQYYTVLWNDPAVGNGPVEVVFEYIQGSSGSRVKRMLQSFPASATSGRASFAVVGDDQLKNGRVLAWQVTLKRGSREIASRRSYLWR